MEVRVKITDPTKSGVADAISLARQNSGYFKGDGRSDGIYDDEGNIVEAVYTPGYRDILFKAFRV